jgi:hypothetical protein
MRQRAKYSKGLWNHIVVNTPANEMVGMMEKWDKARRNLFLSNAVKWLIRPVRNLNHSF